MRLARDRALDVLTVGCLVAALIFAFRNWIARPDDPGDTARAELLRATPVRLTGERVGTGDTVSVDFHEDKLRVVFLFSENCPVCAQQRLIWEQFAEAIESKATTIAISTSGPSTSRYFTSRVVIEMFPQNESDARRSFPASLIPATVIVRGGKVLNLRIGFATAEELTDMLPK